jgi:phage gp36-like protein
MAYCTSDDVIRMLKADMVNVILGDDYIEDEEERLEKIKPLADEAAADASAEIDGYLAKRYSVPLARVPKVIVKFAKDIALYNLVSRHGVDESEREKTYLTRYNAAVAFLTKVAAGTVDIGVSDGDTVTEAAATGFQMHSNGRIFSRESMKGW